MEFWGIEVKPGQPIKTNPGANHLIHLSQASLSESKNKPETVALYVNVDGKKLVLGTLTQHNGAQLSFDLVFEKEFELSHNWKNGSVYFLGYKADMPEEGDDEIDSEDVSSEEEEELPVVAAENGKPKVDTKTAKANAAGKSNAVKQSVKKAEPSKKDEDEDDEDGSDSEDGSGSGDEDDSEDEDNEMSMDGSSDDEDEETPKKVESSKKRPAKAPTPVSGKKAKSAVTPPKTDGKKGGHVATPHPSKTAAKTSGKSPKSGGQFSCETCSKSFGSGGGLESHKKAKHGGK